MLIYCKPLKHEITNMVVDKKNGFENAIKKVNHIDIIWYDLHGHHPMRLKTNTIFFKDNGIQ
jgi:hypothetical protein